MRLNKEFTKDIYPVPIKGYLWKDESVTPKAAIVIYHGMAEHTLRYDNFAEYLTKYGYLVYAFDFIGHGYSKLPEAKVGVLDTTNLINDILGCQKNIYEFVKEEVKDLPIYLFAHSMGSMTAQRYLELNPGDYKKVILSGTDIGGFKYTFLKLITKSIVKKHGYNCYNDTIKKLTLDSFNNKYKKENNNLSWLSLNRENIDIYNADPLCGEVYPVGYFNSMAIMMNEAVNKENIKKINVEKIFLLSGEGDPVSNFGKSVNALYKKYKKAGINVYKQLIPNARHETINENEPVKSSVYNIIKNFYE